MAAKTDWSSSNMVTIRMLICGYVAGSGGVAWIPSMSGICKVHQTMSGWSRPAGLMASRPVTASPTTSMSGAARQRLHAVAEKLMIVDDDARSSVFALFHHDVSLPVRSYLGR